ncbi:hypothetical protein M979_4388 [Buttiauxella noackiae ATCC 51607]|uniref:Uncharacterized protein n=1 Tax=Buttiauxella noackiae ATCC 51607 TaxID=1354255 RepID=A0A1B7HGL1_9ENTR|nr:hypothetical protein M979_4388 [Buttiauxella noackiae ATCC 51607]
MITGFINAESAENRMGTGINGKNKQNPRFLYPADLLK